MNKELNSQNSSADRVAIAIKKAKHDGELATFFDREEDALKNARQYTSPHLIKPIAAFEINDDRCLMFPWADGGNLLNHWRNFNKHRSDPDSLFWVLNQFKGLCSALRELHQSNTRHGDLKPENILWFKDENEHGTLQIADLGLAAFHEKETHTKDRQGVKSMTPSGTSRYEPPEMDQMRDGNEPRSRGYDIWSMGCVLLELLLWLIYGIEAVDTFKVYTPHFWVNDGHKYTLHPYADSCMRVMMTELRDNTAYKDLLILVKQRLLVVSVSKEYGSFPSHREIAAILHDRITAIEQKCHHQNSYLAPVELRYPSDKIREQQDLTPRRTAGLEVPRRQDVPASAGTRRLSSQSADEELVPGVLIRSPTGEVNSGSLSITNLSVPEHQQVSHVPT
jgi:serine/threonine protein kinase